MNKVVITGIIFLFVTSCITQSPKYAYLEQVMALQIGMTKAQVEETLGIEPYDLKSYNDTSNVYIYVYRVKDRKTLEYTTKSTNGRESLGKYVQLEVAYSKKDNKVVNIQSCNLCPDNLVIKQRINFEKVGVFITVTLPSVLLYFGLKQ